MQSIKIFTLHHERRALFKSKNVTQGYLRQKCVFYNNPLVLEQSSSVQNQSGCRFLSLSTVAEWKSKDESKEQFLQCLLQAFFFSGQNMIKDISHKLGTDNPSQQLFQILPLRIIKNKEIKPSFLHHIFYPQISKPFLVPPLGQRASMQGSFALFVCWHPQVPRALLKGLTQGEHDQQRAQLGHSSPQHARACGKETPSRGHTIGSQQTGYHFRDAPWTTILSLFQLWQ